MGSLTLKPVLSASTPHSKQLPCVCYFAGKGPGLVTSTRGMLSEWYGMP